MWIHLLRHGLAEDQAPGGNDDERALTDDGWKRLERAAPAWRELVEPPDRVVTSPLRRARETAEVFVRAVRFRGELEVDDALIPAADPQRALALLEAAGFAGTGSITLIGHEPHLGSMLGALLTGDWRRAMPLKKGMLVGVETNSSTALLGQLRLALTQKAAARLT